MMGWTRAFEPAEVMKAVVVVSLGWSVFYTILIPATGTIALWTAVGGVVVASVALILYGGWYKREEHEN